MFKNDNGQMVPDINDPKDGNMHGNANPHTEPVPAFVDNNVEEPKEESKKAPKADSKAKK